MTKNINLQNSRLAHQKYDKFKESYIWTHKNCSKPHTQPPPPQTFGKQLQKKTVISGCLETEERVVGRSGKKCTLKKYVQFTVCQLSHNKVFQKKKKKKIAKAMKSDFLYYFGQVT